MKPNYKSHEALYKALIFSANEKPSTQIDKVYDTLKHTWFFLNSDEAYFNGREVEKPNRPLCVNQYIVGKPRPKDKPQFQTFLSGKIEYSKTQKNIVLTEGDFNEDIGNWIESKLTGNKLPVVHKRKYREFQEYVSKVGEDISTESEKVLPEIQTDNRQSKSKPKNDVRLKAFIDIFPDFIKYVVEKLDTKEDKGKLIELITGVNSTDAYKKVCTAVPLNITKEEQERIDRFKSKIEQLRQEN